MLSKIMNLLGLGNTNNYADLQKNGAVILDVRSQGEFASGHIEGAINIPVDVLTQNLFKLKDKKRYGYAVKTKRMSAIIKKDDKWIDSIINFPIKNINNKKIIKIAVFLIQKNINKI